VAKKKTTVEIEEEELVKEEDQQSKLYTDYADTIFSAKYLLDKPKKVISVSPAFDVYTGGVPEGSFIALTGKEKCGKSVLSLSIAARAQRPEYINEELCPQGRKIIFFNVEHRLKKRDLEGIHGIDLSDNRFLMVQSSPGKILSSEKFCDRILRFINEEPGCIVIIDSFSMLSSSAEQAADIGYQDRGRSNGIISELMRKIAGPLAVNQCIVIGITHGYANTSGWGAAFVEKSASSLKYSEDIKFFAKKVEPWRIGSDERQPQIGQKVEWDVLFSAILPPGGKVKSHIRYGYGLDEYSELAELACDLAIFEKTEKGGVYTLKDVDKKIRGTENVIEYLKANPSYYELIKNEVYEMSGVECR
jgi:RecA/RadA recombinase